MPPGASRKYAVKVRIKPAARGRVTPIRLTARGPDIASRSTRVRLRVRR
jgi:hypothetical protein